MCRLYPAKKPAGAGIWNAAAAVEDVGGVGKDAYDGVTENQP
ncbi:MAG: hypothetical protein Fur0016_30890 [Anaerolineales bacterium]